MSERVSENDDALVSELFREWEWWSLVIEGVSGWVSERDNPLWVKEWVSGWVREWVSEWVSEWEWWCSCEWTSEWVSDDPLWVKEWVSEGMSEWGNEWVSEWMNEWVSESDDPLWVSEWVSEWVRMMMLLWVNEWVSAYVKEECACELGTAASAWWRRSSRVTSEETLSIYRDGCETQAQIWYSTWWMSCPPAGARGEPRLVVAVLLHPHPRPYVTALTRQSHDIVKQFINPLCCIFTYCLSEWKLISIHEYTLMQKNNPTTPRMIKRLSEHYYNMWID